MKSDQEILLCHLKDIPNGKARGFEFGPNKLDRIVVVRKGKEVRAFHDICPHYGATTLPWKKDEYMDPSGEYLMCAAHGALFNTNSGECIAGPCIGDRLTPVNIKLNQNEELTAVISGECSE
jgi:nitrite reductase/ring-hydroxylating ferredoxin subunit